MPKRYIAFSVLTGLSALLFSFAKTSAQVGEVNSLNLTTSPLPISLVAKPGDVITRELRIRNDGDKTEQLKVGLMKFRANGEDGKPELHEREKGDDYFEWVSFSDQKITAEPRVWKTVKMSIAIPKTAAFGYYYAVTFTRTTATSTPTVQNAKIVGGSASLVLLDVQAPGAKKNLQLQEFSVTKRSYEFLPATLHLKVHNSGNVHVVPSGSIYIEQGKRRVDTIHLNETQGNVLPDSSRRFESVWDKGFPRYEAKTQNRAVVLVNGVPENQLIWKTSDIKNLRFGRYTAHLLLVYDNGEHDATLEATVSFWVIPWRILGLFVGLPLLLIAVIVYLLLSRRRYKQKATYRH